MVNHTEHLATSAEMSPHIFLSRIGITNLREFYFADLENPLVLPQIEVSDADNQLVSVRLDQFNTVIRALNLNWSVPLYAERVSGDDLLSYYLNFSFQSDVTISADDKTIEKARRLLRNIGSINQKLGIALDQLTATLSVIGVEWSSTVLNDLLSLPTVMSEWLEGSIQENSSIEEIEAIIEKMKLALLPEAAREVQ